MNKAIFGAGCFWRIEAIFQQLKGVTRTEVGYMGGKESNPSYELVCSGQTTFVEVVTVNFKPSIISYDNLLDVFWKIHDPTSWNRQGVDIGHQYKSIIYYINDEQKKLAVLSKNKLNESDIFSIPIVTKIEKAQTFFPAEEYHQNYFKKII